MNFFGFGKGKEHAEKLEKSTSSEICSALERGNFKKKKIQSLKKLEKKNIIVKVIRGIAMLILFIAILLVCFFNRGSIINVFSGDYKENQASSGSATYSVYGVDAFTEEYSIGAFFSAKSVKYAFGSGFLVGTNNGGGSWRRYYICSNKYKKRR